MTPKAVLVLKSVGSAVAAACGALAAANTFPSVTPVLSAIAGLLGGWLHLAQPKAAS